MANVVFLESVRRFPKFYRRVKRMLNTALKYFPELSGETVYVGVEKHYEGRADSLNNIVFFNPNKPLSFVTVFHELMHLAVAAMRRKGAKVPASEQYVSIASIARMPAELYDENSIPYIIDEIPEHLKQKIPELCRQALEYRKHRRNYIQYLLKAIKH